MRPAFHCQSIGKSSVPTLIQASILQRTNSALTRNLAVSSIRFWSGGHMASDSPTVSPSTSRAPAPYSIAPWLSIRNGARAVDFYKAAFGALESHRLEDPTGAVVAKLTVSGAVFWVSGESPEEVNATPELV